MNEKQENQEIKQKIYRNSRFYIQKVKYEFYALFALVLDKAEKNINDNKVNNNNSQNSVQILESIKKLKEMITNLNENLKYFNKTEKNQIIDDKFAENILNNRYVKINKQFYIYYLWLNYRFKKKIFIIIKPFIEEQNIQENKKINDNDDNIIENKQKNDISEIQKYIEKIILKSKKNGIIIDIKIQFIKKNNFQIITKNFIIELNNDKNNFIDGEIDVKVQNRYQQLNNILLLSKIESFLSEEIQFFTNKYRKNVDNFLSFMKSFIIYIYDYDFFLKTKCCFCNKNAIYSLDEKGFIPPYIKYNIEKFNILNNIPIKSRDKLFYHPQCMSL